MNSTNEATQIFQQGDIVMVNLDPKKGHEQAGYRPCVVVSIPDLQRLTGIFWVFPISTTDTVRRISVYLEPSEMTGNKYGQILCGHIAEIDPSARNVKLVGKCPKDVYQKVDKTLSMIIHK